MNLPNKFTINTQEITVEILECLDGMRFGEFDSVLNIIKIASHIKRDGKLIVLTTDQMWNTFFHEVIHAWQFFATGNTCEEDACTYAGYILEFMKTSNFENELKS